jgi:hypothetical protein
MQRISLSGARIFLNKNGEDVLIVYPDSGNVYERVGNMFTPLWVSYKVYNEATPATSINYVNPAHLNEEELAEFLAGNPKYRGYAPAMQENKYWSFFRVYDGLEVRAMPQDGAPLYGGEFRITGDKLTLNEFCWEDGIKRELSIRQYREVHQVRSHDGQYGKFAAAKGSPSLIDGIHALDPDYCKMGEIDVIPLPDSWTPYVEMQDSVWEHRKVGRITVLVQETQSGPKFSGILQKWVVTPNGRVLSETKIKLTAVGSEIWSGGITLGSKEEGQFNLSTDLMTNKSLGRWISSTKLETARRNPGRSMKQWINWMNRRMTAD